MFDVSEKSQQNLLFTVDVFIIEFKHVNRKTIVLR